MPDQQPHTPTDYDMQEQFEAGAMATGFAEQMADREGDDE